MEPTQRNNSVPDAAEQPKKRTVVSPLISLPNRPHESDRDTPTNNTIPVSEDDKYTDTELSASAFLPRPSSPKRLTPPGRRSSIPRPSISHQQTVDLRDVYPASRIQKPQLVRQTENVVVAPPPSPRKIVRVLAAPQPIPAAANTVLGSPFGQQTGSLKWDRQVSHYPAELMEIIETETREMQAIVTQAPSPAQARKKLRRKKRRVPEMRQVTAVECGAACLGMVLNYYGYATSISEVQERCGVGRDGLTALELVKSARLYGLRVRAISLDLADFRYVTLPAIVHWEFNHFLIVERWSPTRIDVVDPAQGRRQLTAEEFDEGFTGVAIMLEPGEQFSQKAAQKSLTPWSYMRSLLQMHRIIFQVVGASLLLQLLGLGAPLLTEIIIDRILPGKDPNLLTLLVGGMLILVLMQGITTFLRSSLLIYLQTRSDTNMMLNFFEHLLSLPYRFFQLRLSGDLLARMNSNLAIRDLLTNQLISTLLDGTTVIIYFIILFSLSRFIAGVTLAIGLIQLVILLLTSPVIRKLTQRDLEARGKTQGYMNEILSGIATLKAAGAEQRAFARWENLFFDETNISLRLSYLSSVIGILLTLVSLLSPLLLLWIGAMQVIDGVMTVGTMLALNTLAIQFLSPLGSLAGTVENLQIVRAHFSRVADVIEAQPEQDPLQVQSPHRLKGHIELKHVSFQYNQNAPMILQDINVRIFPGQKIALVGQTGSGKSTLGKLLVGLITPTKGKILFDNIPLDTLNYQEVRSQFGVVLQESFIFSGSVKENIALNNPAMNMPQIVEAARLAAIDEDIEKMPMSYDTLVSEGGSAFSGGQRQRLALARALANHPSLLLLDEATSALDVMTEHTIEQNLRHLPCTQIIIAHRLSTVRNADVILVLDHGRIVQQGTHEQLLKSNGFYARLIQTQLTSV